MKIVIVDGAQTNVSVFLDIVDNIPDCETVTFSDLVVAINWCSDNEPDLMVVDYGLQQSNGAGLAERFRKQHPDIPVLVVTESHAMESHFHVLQVGVTDFLVKPVNRMEFLSRVKSMLALRKGHRELALRTGWLVEEVNEAYQALERNAEQERETIFCLAKAAEYRDPETGAHILRMAHYSKHIANIMGLPLEQQDILLQASPMHDIGKVGTPDLILLKPGKLNDEEFSIMKRHAVTGYEVLKECNSPLLKVAAEIAYTHHERMDGTGYPRGLKGKEIPLFGRIVAVADVFDALTSERPYKSAWDIEQASQLVREEQGKHFDPECVTAFFTDFNEVLAIKSKFVDERIELRDRTVE